MTYTTSQTETDDKVLTDADLDDDKGLNEVAPPDDADLMASDDDDLMAGVTVGVSQTKTRRTTDLVRLYLQEIGRVRLLERDEEVSEAQHVQRYMELIELRDSTGEQSGGVLETYARLMRTRDRLTSHLGYRPSLEKWAKESEVPLADLKPTLIEGKRVWAELAEISTDELDVLLREGIRAKEHMI